MDQSWESKTYSFKMVLHANTYRTTLTDDTRKVQTYSQKEEFPKEIVHINFAKKHKLALFITKICTLMLTTAYVHERLFLENVESKKKHSSQIFLNCPNQIGFSKPCRALCPTAYSTIFEVCDIKFENCISSSMP